MKALVVDGYNVIYRIPALEAKMDISLQEARRGVTDLARAYQRRCGGIDKVLVVFDGKTMYRRMGHRDEPYNIYSNTGEGDLEVVRAVGRFSKNYHAMVVTDDNFIRNNARAHGATIISVSDFASFLYRRKGSAVKKRDAEEKKVGCDAASSINEELKKHWNIS